MTYARHDPRRLRDLAPRDHPDPRQPSYLPRRLLQHFRFEFLATQNEAIPLLL
jgi:hypothetical protein